MKIFKKNQLVILVITLMLVTAGYLNYTANQKDNILETNANALSNELMAALGDATLVSSSNVMSNEIQQNTTDNNQTNEVTNVEEQNNTIPTYGKVITKDDYFATSRLGRDAMYSQMIESYQNILVNTSISEEQKAISAQEIKKINDTKNAVMIVENLIKTKGFNDCIIFINDKSISAVIKSDNLEQEQVAQIQNIISRELNAQIENIHISNK